MRGRCEALLPVRGAYCTLQVLFSTQPILLNVRYALRTASFVAHYPRTTRRYAPRGTRLSKMWYASRTICPALSQFPKLKLVITGQVTSDEPSYALLSAVWLVTFLLYTVCAPAWERGCLACVPYGGNRSEVRPQSRRRAPAIAARCGGNL